MAWTSAAVRATALGAKAVKRRQRAAWGDFEDRAIAVGPASVRRPAEIPIGGLDQPRPGVGAVRAVEAVLRRQRAAWGDFEDRAIAVGPAREGCPVEDSSLGVLDQPRDGEVAVRYIKAVQRGQRAAWGDFEERAIAVAVGPAPVRRPVEVPTGGLDQPRVGASALRVPSKAVQCRQRATWRDFENRAIAVGPAHFRSPVEVPVGGQYQPRVGLGAVRATALGAKAVKRRQRAAWGDFEGRPAVVGPP